MMTTPDVRLALKDLHIIQLQAALTDTINFIHCTVVNKRPATVTAALDAMEKGKVLLETEPTVEDLNQYVLGLFEVAGYERKGMYFDEVDTPNMYTTLYSKKEQFNDY